MTHDETSFREQFEKDKRAATAQLLFKCARLVNDRAIERVRQQTGMPLRAAHTALFPHLDLAGTRQTVLAERLGVTKQAVGQLVEELVNMGFLERIPDPEDGRAKRIRFVPGGLNEGLSVLMDIERELAGMIGRENMDHFRKALLKLEQALESP